jgi:O-antigen/teichoic acid export membrane protein
MEMSLVAWRKLWGNNSTAMQLLLMQVLAASTAFAVNILSASVMEPEGRGQLALLVQVTYVLTVIALLGVERPYVAVRKTSFDRAVTEMNALATPGYLLLIVIAIVVVLCALAGWLKIALIGGLVLFFLMGNIAARIVRTGYIASGSLPPFIAVSIATQMILLFTAVGLYFWGNTTPDAWFFAYGLSGTAALIVLIGSVCRSGRTGFPELRQIRSSGIRLLPASFGNTAMLRSDRLLLPLLASNAQLGLYVVVATTMELASWPIQNWVDASLNRWREHQRNDRGYWRTIAGAALVTTLLAACLGGASYIVIQFALSPAYSESAILILPLAFAAVVYAATRVQQGLLIAGGRAKSVSAAELVGMVVSLGAYLLLIPNWGAMGAAIASIIGYFCCFIAGLILMRRSLDSRVLQETSA